MTNVDVDLEIAVGVMGWPHHMLPLSTKPKPPYVYGANGGIAVKRKNYGPACIWSPSTDLRHAAEAEARLTEVQQHTYYSELSRVVNTPGGGAFAHIWSMLTATPAQRAAALLAVLKGGK